ncbi:hypothetical protein N9P53_02275 [Flavobacteriaceae bacterium]|nr:hypothetical protein [Flavobacteriaceae bacterium]
MHRKDDVVQSITGKFAYFEEENISPKLTLREVEKLFKNSKIKDIELVILPSNLANKTNEKPVLVYKVMTLEEDVFINANSGIVEFKTSNVFDCHSTHAEVSITNVNKSNGIATANATLHTKNYNQISLPTKQQSNTYLLHNDSKNIKVYDGRQGVNAEENYVDNDNNWTSDEYDNVDKDIYALDAYYAANKTYDFFQTELNRNGINGLDGEIKLFINEDNQANASWTRL